MLLKTLFVIDAKMVESVKKYDVELIQWETETKLILIRIGAVIQLDTRTYPCLLQ